MREWKTWLFFFVVFFLSSFVLFMNGSENASESNHASACTMEIHGDVSKNENGIGNAIANVHCLPWRGHMRPHPKFQNKKKLDWVLGWVFFFFFFNYLMRPETRIVQFLDGILHVLSAEKLDDASSVLEDISKAHVSSLAHMILQILPAPRGR